MPRTKYTALDLSSHHNTHVSSSENIDKAGRIKKRFIVLDDPNIDNIKKKFDEYIRSRKTIRVQCEYIETLSDGSKYVCNTGYNIEVDVSPIYNMYREYCINNSKIYHYMPISGPRTCPRCYKKYKKGVITITSKKEKDKIESKHYSIIRGVITRNNLNI